MHRSGTSAITRGLVALGVSLGDNLMPPTHGENDLGFFEDLDIYRLNERLLNKLGSAWHQLSPLNDATMTGPAFSVERREAVAVLRKKTHERPFGFKDPRTAVLLPFWRCAFEDLGLDARYIIVARNPIEAAISLQKRNEIPLAKGVMLWAKHTIDALRHTQGAARVVVAYPRLLADPLGQIGRLASALGLPEPSSASHQVQTYCEEFITPSLRHATISTQELKRSGLVPHFIIDLYDELEALAAAPPDAAIDDERWNEIITRWREHAPLLTFIDELDGELISTRCTLLEESRLRQEASDAAQKAATDRARAEAALKSAQAELQQAQALSAAADSTREQISHELEQIEKTLKHERLLRQQEIDAIQRSAAEDRERLSEDLRRAREELAAERRHAREMLAASNAAEAERNRVLAELRDTITKIEEGRRLAHAIEEATKEHNKLTAELARSHEERRQIERECEQLQHELNLARITADRDRAESEQALMRVREDERVQTMERLAQFVHEAKQERDRLLAQIEEVKRGADSEREQLLNELRATRKEAERERLLAVAASPARNAAQGETTNAAPAATVAPALATIFDADYYRRQHPDVAQAGVDPLTHFLDYGWLEGRNPCALFDTQFYLRRNHDVAEAGVNPLIHYALAGASEGRAPSPLFDPQWYLENNPDIADAARDNPLAHYLTVGAAEGRSANPIFDQAWYLDADPVGLSEATCALSHYAEHGLNNRLSPHPLFDGAFYIDRYPEVAQTGVNPLAHFLMYGHETPLRPHPSFDSAWYLLANPDVAQAHANPLVHYVRQGAKEGRAMAPPPPETRNEAPRSLKDYLLETGRESAIVDVNYLTYLAATYGERDGEFEASSDFAPLLRWLRYAARPKGRGAPPEVSIVIPAYNKLVLTFAAIASVLGSPSRYSFEIIVADDCSNDATASAVPSVGGCVRLVRNAGNLGFLLNCNRAAETALGRYLVILNNDTIALPGWLDNLIAPLEQHPDVGMTGSKLLNLDGTLQEAGGILWGDGSAWNFGRNQDPSAPEFNYAKEVDYCSGASIAFRTEDWRRLGGFDPHFSPAYCEDSDIAFRTRQIGLKVLYAPHSEIIHHEGMSHGRDVTQGLKAYQAVNTQKFFERWRDTLQSEHFANGEHVPLARDRSRAKPHILFVDHYVPQWDKDAGSRSIYDCMRFFIARGFHVTLWPDNLYYDEPYVRRLQQAGVEVLYGSALVGRFEEWWRQNGSIYQYALLSRCHIAISYVDIVRSNGDCTVLYYGHDLPWKRLQAEYLQTGNLAVLPEAERIKEMEDSISSKAHYIIYPSKEECDYARAAFPQAKGVIEMPVWVCGDDMLDIGRTATERIAENASCTALFVGGFAHPPNGDGIRWFLDDVLPLVLSQQPRFEVCIAGSHMPADIKARAAPHINVKGWVSDAELAELTAEAACTIAPLRFGAGVKGKVIYALASGSPVVSTSFGMQGIPDADEIAFVGDTAEAFAEALVLCLTDRRRAQAKARRALDVIRQHYSPTAMARAFAPAFPAPIMQSRPQAAYAH